MNYSWFPICPWGHKSWGLRSKHVQEQMAKYNDRKIHDRMENVCDLTGKKKYKITCKKCKRVMGSVWAGNKSLKDWCSFRYSEECLTPNISPITGFLGFECKCGIDTRCFKLTNPEKEKEAQKGREYGKKNSSFLVKEVK